MMTDAEVVASMRRTDDVRRRLEREGYSLIHRGPARFRKGDEYLNAMGEPVDPPSDPAAPPAPTLLDEAHGMVDVMAAPDLARLVMGERIDGATLDRLLESMSIEDALAEYTVPALKTYLSSKDVTVGSEKREQLVELIRIAHTEEVSA